VSYNSENTVRQYGWKGLVLVYNSYIERVQNFHFFFGAKPHKFQVLKKLNSTESLVKTFKRSFFSLFFQDPT